MSSKQPIPKKIKQLVWNNYIGEKNGIGLCQCCQITEISQMNFHCGHIISEKNGGDIILNNLTPICSLCNSSMGTTNMDNFIKKHGLKVNDKIVNALAKEDKNINTENDIKKSSKNNKEDKNINTETDIKKSSKNNKEDKNINTETDIKKSSKNNKEDKKPEITNNIYNQIIENNSLEDFLTSLTIKKLRQLCYSLSSIKRPNNQVSNNISPNGTKDKVIKKIIKNNYEYNDIIELINKIKKCKYFIRCNGDRCNGDVSKNCKECTVWDDFVSQCENCDTSHAYYTDTKLSDEKDIIKTNYIFIHKDSGKTCSICKCNTNMDEYVNAFNL